MQYTNHYMHGYEPNGIYFARTPKCNECKCTLPTHLTKKHTPCARNHLLVLAAAVNVVQFWCNDANVITLCQPLNIMKNEIMTGSYICRLGSYALAHLLLAFLALSVLMRHFIWGQQTRNDVCTQPKIENEIDFMAWYLFCFRPSFSFVPINIACINVTQYLMETQQKQRKKYQRQNVEKTLKIRWLLSKSMRGHTPMAWLIAIEQHEMDLQAMIFLRSLAEVINVWCQLW